MNSLLYLIIQVINLFQFVLIIYIILTWLVNFNIINTGAKLEHEVALGDYNHIAPSATVCGRAEIKNKVLLGASCIVIPKLKIGSNVTIGANSTLIKNAITPDSILVGTPAVEK